jgi:hypothetical protein
MPQPRFPSATSGIDKTRFRGEMGRSLILRGFLALILLATVVRPAAGLDFLWFEGEGAGGEPHQELSGEAMSWMNPGARLRRDIEIPAAGTYALWVRKFWNPQAMRWRVGDGPWMKVAADAPLQDLVDLSPGRRVGWFLAGESVLPAGPAVFEMEVTDPKNVTAYDCFLLTREPFTPRGRLRPGEAVGSETPGWFAFDPGPDIFSESPIDLRFLNEREAGEGGFIGVRDGEFIHTRTGRPVRFWAVNTGKDMARRSRGEIDRFARSLAKRGVNLVRLHGPVFEEAGPIFGQIDKEQVAGLHYLIAALKREGIYSCLSIYFPLWARLGPENPDFPGYTGQHPFALLYFNPKFQELYRSWWEYLLTTPNPHTGLALRDDPAVAMAELVNEDSLFFWTFNPDRPTGSNIPEPQRALIEKQFGDWLRGCYPGRTLEEIRDGPWQGLATKQDNFPAGRVGFRPLWNIANERTPRDRDTARFLAELQREFYQAAESHLKETLGFRGLVSASNWQTASASILGPLDKWTNSLADFMDRHGYFSGDHSGQASGYAIRTGQNYADRSALFFRGRKGENFGNPLFDVAYNGLPSVISEVGWPLPNRYRAEFPPLAAAYGSLHGTDALFHFAAQAPAWGGLPGKFDLMTPTQFGQFPAAALIFREGLIRTAAPVVQLRLPVEDLLNLEGAPVPEAMNLDPLRAADRPAGRQAPQLRGFDAAAFLVGRVTVDFLKSGRFEARFAELSPHVDRKNQTARSLTGELLWNWGRGLVTIDAPAVQGAVGFLAAAHPIALSQMAVEPSLEYGTVLLVTLDGQPISQSRKILLQVMSEERPDGWETGEAGKAGLRPILSTGRPPLLVRNLAGTVSLKRGDAGRMKVTALDANGYPASETFLHGQGILLQPNRFYYLIESPDQPASK